MLVENTGSTPNKSHPTLLAAPAIGFRSPNVRVVLWGIWQIIPCCPAATNDTFMIFQWYFTQTHLGVSQKHTHTQKKKRKSILFALIYTGDYCHYFTWNNPLTYHPSWLVFRHDLLLHRCAFRCVIVAPSVVSLQRSALTPKKNVETIP